VRWGDDDNKNQNRETEAREEKVGATTIPAQGERIGKGPRDRRDFEVFPFRDFAIGQQMVCSLT